MYTQQREYQTRMNKKKKKIILYCNSDQWVKAHHICKRHFKRFPFFLWLFLNTFFHYFQIFLVLSLVGDDKFYCVVAPHFIYVWKTQKHTTIAMRHNGLHWNCLTERNDFFLWTHSSIFSYPQYTYFFLYSILCPPRASRTIIHSHACTQSMK